MFSTSAQPSEARPAFHWMALAVVSLVLAGALAGALVIGRAPVISEWIDDPRFFRRALVVHVVLSLWGWFMAYAAGLRSLVAGGNDSSVRSRLGRGLAIAGIAVLVASAGIKGAEPLLVNYIPVVDHPVFLAGLAAFFGGVALELCRMPSTGPAAEPTVPTSAAIAWRATGPVAGLAVVVFALSLATTPTSLGGEVFYELLFWGAGHTLQVVSVLVMVGAWLYLLRDRADRAPIGPKATLWLVVALVAPWLIGPFLVVGGTQDGTYIRGFTRLMQFGIAGPVVVTIVWCVPAALEKATSRAGRWAFWVSAALTVVGFVLGAMIRGSDTMIPAHYHASLGAITVALMALAYALARTRGWTPTSEWWRRASSIQPTVFGAGQLIFAIGFAISGAAGVARKSYGAEQIIDSTGALVGLATMGLGGLLAVVGGAAFIGLVGYMTKEAVHRNRRRQGGHRE